MTMMTMSKKLFVFIKKILLEFIQTKTMNMKALKTSMTSMVYIMKKYLTGGKNSMKRKLFLITKLILVIMLIYIRNLIIGNSME